MTIELQSRLEILTEGDAEKCNRGLRNMVTTITTVTMVTLDLSILETSFQHCITKLGAYCYQLNLRFLPQFVRER
jgi:hypothetical protein